MNVKTYCNLSLIVIGAVSVALSWKTANATVVRPMPIQVLADNSVVVVVGTVTNVTSYWTGNPRTIESLVELNQTEHLKGENSSGTPMSFVVPGGTVGEMTMRLAGAPEFAEGDRWVLMLRSTYKTHPVAGYNQGAFKFVQLPGGQTAIANSDSQIVTGFCDKGFIHVQQSAPASAQASCKYGCTFSHTSHSVATNSSPTADPIGIDALREMLLPVIEKSRVFDADAPVAKREYVTLQPTSLKAMDGKPVTAEAIQLLRDRASVPRAKRSPERTR